MASDLMTICEQKKLFKKENERYWKWVKVDVSTLTSGSQPDVRCAHCHGKVRVHRRQVEHGPADHVEHITRQDSENCKGGHYFNGQHKNSTDPVE